MHDQPNDAAVPLELLMSEVQSKNKPVSDFPGHADAGKLLQWISRQISVTQLGANLLSALEAPNDCPMSHQRNLDQKVALP